MALSTDQENKMTDLEKEPFKDPHYVEDGATATFSESNPDSSDENKQRGNWGKEIDFFFSCIGYAVGLGNIWRFPYLCMRNGGGAFLIPYFFFLVIGGVPLFFIELYIGQFSSRSPLAVWDMCPLFKGTGWGMTIVSLFFSIYYQVIVTWVIYYLGMSFQNPLPWSHCNNEWNTPNCSKRGENRTTFNDTSFFNYSNFNSSIVQYAVSTPAAGSLANDSALNRSANVMTPAEEFWQYNALEMSSGIDSTGGLRWQLVVCHLVGWLVVFLCVIKGIKTSGKVVYVTATVPYVFLVILLIRGCTLPGATEGIIYYIKPDFSKLLEFRIWAEACLQIFYSLGTAWGGLITMASYNTFHHNFYRDAITVPIINCLTSFTAGFVVFSVIGFMAKEAGVPVKDAITSGPGLAFIAYPEAISQLPFSPAWAVLFFVMLLTIGLDTQFATFETLVSGIVDRFRAFRGKKFLVMIGVGSFEALIGLVFMTRAGIYHFQIWDWYSGAFSVMIFAVLECLVLSYIYGGKRLFYEIEMMIGYRPNFGWRILLGGVTPASMFVCLAYATMTFSSPNYGEYFYPEWAKIMGWMLAVFSILPIPGFFIYELVRTKGSPLERLKHSVRPAAGWGPAIDKNRKGYIYDLVDSVELTEMA
ncbi:sodium- and chloride-dependent glycine transporter 1-like [Lineus longissimus]|uniref:sodium- and chloride-dependent glycine transporter 1-like n=1 Tax=Lineus longissimus TaxID=88925 RepID=UPI002B4CD1B3